MRPVEPPAGAVAAVSTDATADWWATFGDDRLTRLVRRAVADATDVGIAQARLRQARAVRSQTAGGRLPQVGLGVSTQASLEEGEEASRRSASLAPDAAWQLDFSGRIARGLEAADADLAAAAITVAATRVSVAAETALAYLQWRGAQTRLTLAEASLAAQEATLRIVRWRAEAGLVSALDVDQAESSAAQTRAQIAPLRITQAQQAHALAVLTGSTPTGLDAELAAPAPMPRPPPGLALALPADTLRQRPDVAVAEARVRAAAARVAEADTARLPSLSLRGSIGLNALSLSGLASGARFTTTLGGSVSLPILDGGARRATVRQREAGFDEARLAHRAAVLQALREVEDALVAIARQREQQADLATAIDAARRAAALADTRYRGGLVDFTTVLTTRRTLLALEDSAAAVDTALAAGHVQLYKALGGGWTPSGETLR